MRTSSTPASPWMPQISISSAPIRSCLGLPGTVQVSRATPIVKMPNLAASAAATIASRLSPPPTDGPLSGPNRACHSARLRCVGDGDVVGDDHHFNLEAERLCLSAARPETTVPGIVLHHEKAAGRPRNSDDCGQHTSTLGDANISPQTAADQKTLAHKSACDGWCPDPPPEMTATLDRSQSLRSTTRAWLYRCERVDRRRSRRPSLDCFGR